MEIGRNQVCTCGSSKKYKKCCGKNIKVDRPLPVPAIVFPSFTEHKKIMIILWLILMLAIVVYGINKTYTVDDLKGLSEFTLNLTLVMGALGITIFSLTLSKDTQTKENKDKLVTSYIGTICLETMFAICGYTLAILIKEPNYIIKIWCIVQLSINSYIVIHTVSAIMAFFNITDKK